MILPLLLITPVIGGGADSETSGYTETSDEDDSALPLKTYDKAVLSLMYTPLGTRYDATNDKYKLMAEKIYRENNMDIPDLTHLIQPIYPKHTIADSVDQYLPLRVLSSTYPFEIFDSSIQINHIQYEPRESAPIKYDALIELIYRCLITLNIRDLTKEESDKATRAVQMFRKGLITKPIKTVYMNSGEVYQTETCHKKMTETIMKKSLHWGQRKLLLSEMDFFNRAAHDMGVDKFKSNPISVLYPGSAHGDHLMILMELYPNIILYLWDPAKYNPVLYLAEFMRRKLPLPRHTSYEKTMATKYTNRLFINMELTNEEFIQYHHNSTNCLIPDNYITQHGFFLPKSIKYFLEHRVKHNDTSKILFVSDIRMYTNSEITTFINANKPIEINNPVVSYFLNNLPRLDHIRDMDIQKKWFLDSKSDYGLFKFKLALPKTSQHPAYYEYLDGDIIIQSWGPANTSETRLFVKPNRQPAAYYNINRYRGMLQFFNHQIRNHTLSRYALRKLNINLDTTMSELWADFLPQDKIGADALLETYILCDYLRLHKAINLIDLKMLISDITQTLINKTDQTGILSYLHGTLPRKVQQKKFKIRRRYHEKFNPRLDFKSGKYDNLICQVD